MNGLGLALVVEDDDDVRRLLEDVLRHAGFEVHTAATGREGAELARTERPTVVTLDVGLPDIDGFEVLRRIRASSDAYVVMLTAHDDETDTLVALQAGADDYLTKPFRPRELRARIGAMMRRPRESGARAPEGPGAPQQLQAPPRPETPPRATTEPRPAGRSQPETPPESETPVQPETPAQPDPVLRHRGLALDPRTRRAAVSGHALELTRTEFDLLHALLRGHGRVLTRAELVRVARGDRFRQDAYVSEADERAVEVHLGNLRRKLGDDPRSPRWLVTVRGVGYRMVAAA